MEKQIAEGNRVIAEWMGMKCVKDTESYGDSDYEWLPRFEHSNWCFKSPPPFHSSWDWLMSVVERIEAMGYEFVINFKVASVEFNECSHRFVSDTKLEATYQAVLSFITFYNNTNGK